MAKKKKQESALTEQQEAVLAAINKSYGAGTLMTLGSAPEIHDFKYQIPTGSIGLDMAIGPIRRLPDGRWRAGLAPGKFLEIFGPEASGKTTLMLHMIANAQAMGLSCAFLDMEHALDFVYARQLGVNMDKLTFGQPDSGDQCMEIVDNLLRSGQYQFIVVDSIASLVTEAELAKEIGDETMGQLPKLMSKSLKKMNPELEKNNCTIAFTNQLRFKIGPAAKYGNPEYTPGGEALKFYSCYRLDIRGNTKLTAGSDDNAAVIGKRAKMKVIKNKVAPPFQSTEFNIIFGRGVDHLDELFDLCVSRGVISLTGSWYEIPGQGKVQGKAQAMQMLYEVHGLNYRLYDELMTRVCAERGFTPEGERIPGWRPNIVHAAVNTFAPVSDEQEQLEEQQVG